MELNADIGEGGPDALLMPYVQRVSIACGGHTGDLSSMRRALQLAKQHGVLAGAHPGYPDRTHFGRKAMTATADQITNWVASQVSALQSVAGAQGMELFHVKPHGALYHQAAFDQETALGVIAAMKGSPLALVALAGAPLVGWARAAGLMVLEEAFADRRYLADGQLSSRNLPGAVIESAQEAAEQAKAISLGAPVTALDGGAVRIKADTLCLHGDGSGADERARAVARALSARR